MYYFHILTIKFIIWSPYTEGRTETWWKIFGNKREEVTDGWTTLQEEFTICTHLELLLGGWNKVGWDNCGMANAKEGGNVNDLTVWEAQGKGKLGRSRCQMRGRWEMVLKETKRGDIWWNKCFKIGTSGVIKAVMALGLPVPVAARSTAARLLRSWDRILPWAWIFVYCVCQVQVSATNWTLVQRSPTDCGVSLCVIKKPRGRGDHRPRWAAEPEKI
jgi:hypothetical protein